MDKVLSFRLRLTLKIFSALADVLQWILHHNGISKGFHYLDHYILVAKDHQPALAQKETLVKTFQTLGVPLEFSKLEGPETCLTFLGIEVDTSALQLHLPRDKLDKLKWQLRWAISFRRSIPKEELESLVGLLHFATKVVRTGRPFLRRLYILKDVGSQPHHLVILKCPEKADILWRYIFVDSWNGISLLWDLGLQNPMSRVCSDASGSWGMVHLADLDGFTSSGLPGFTALYCSKGDDTSSYSNSIIWPPLEW